MKKIVDIQLEHKDSVSVITDIKDFINNTYSGVSGSPIIDPISDSGKTRGTGTYIANDDSEVLSANYPKITFEIVELPRSRVAGGKSVYRERFRTQFAILYECHKGHTWTYNSISYKNKQQCVRYLEYLGDQLKKYSGSFIDMNEMVIGSVSPPVLNSNSATYTAFLTVNVDSYGRVGV